MSVRRLGSGLYSAEANGESSVFTFDWNGDAERGNAAGWTQIVIRVLQRKQTRKSDSSRLTFTLYSVSSLSTQSLFDTQGAQGLFSKTRINSPIFLSNIFERNIVVNI